MASLDEHYEQDNDCMYNKTGLISSFLFFCRLVKRGDSPRKNDVKSAGSALARAPARAGARAREEARVCAHARARVLAILSASILLSHFARLPDSRLPQVSSFRPPAGLLSYVPTPKLLTFVSPSVFFLY